MILKAAFLLLCAVCMTSGRLLRSDEHVRNRNMLMKFLDAAQETIISDIRNYTSTGYRSKAFDMWVNANPNSREMWMSEVDDYSPETAIIGCAACRTFGAALIRDLRSGASEQELADTAFGLCRILTPFSDPVCRGAIDLNVESVVYILRSDPLMTSTQVCAFVLQGECGDIDPAWAFTVNVDPAPPITQPKSVLTPRSPDELKILHVTDLHYDPHYMAGGFGQCPNPVCCRRADGIPTNPADAAGVWGDYRDCDTPWLAVEETIRRMAEAHPDADIIYHTGDIVDHGVWETTEAGNVQIMERVYNLFRQYFGTKPVFNVIANHEAQPTNIFAPSWITRPSLSTRWLYDYTANTFQRHGWVTDPAALATIRHGGYYTVLARPGFRIIGMNNNDCYTFNWWIMYSRVEVQSAMQWLHTTLLAAERNNERVHILKHIPSGGGSCYHFWSREYRRVIERFNHIIGAQFNGHSHRDEFEIFYDRPTATHAINVAWNGGGATAFSNFNPNYHLYYVDRVHYQVNDFDSYIYSISEANRTPQQRPRWYRLYSFREAFGLTDTSPAGLDRFAWDLSRNRNLLRRYWEFKVKMGDPLIAQGCNDDCLRNQVCSIAVNEVLDHRRCNQILSVFGQIA